jgi:hypothetical protein
MEAPATYDITIRKGNDYEQLFEFQQSDGSAMNLTGFTIESQVRAKQSRDATLIISFTVIIPDPTNGKVYLKLTDTETGALLEKSGYYDILVISPSGFDEIYLEGRVFIEPIVTVKV